MKSYLKQFGYALVMLIAGLCPMGMGMVFIGIAGRIAFSGCNVTGLHRHNYAHGIQGSIDRTVGRGIRHGKKIVSAIWAVVHFGGTLPRFIDIFIVGIILSIIFTKSGNIIYCMVFHSVANIAIYIVSVNSTFFADKIWLLYVSVPLFVVLTGLLVHIFNKRKIVKD